MIKRGALYLHWCGSARCDVGAPNGKDVGVNILPAIAFNFDFN